MKTIALLLCIIYLIRIVCVLKSEINALTQKYKKHPKIKKITQWAKNAQSGHPS
jgi:hypothetical protein